MALSISIESDVKAAARWLKSVQKKQIPFAVKNTLNRMAFSFIGKGFGDPTNYLQEQWERDLDARREMYKTGTVHVEKAKKTDVPITARVTNRENIQRVLEKQIKGGTFRTMSGDRYIVPEKFAQTKKRKLRKPVREGLKGNNKKYRLAGNTLREIKTNRRVLSLSRTIKTKPRFNVDKVVDAVAAKGANILEQELSRALETAK